MLGLLNTLASIIGWIAILLFVPLASWIVFKNAFALFSNAVNIKQKYGPWAVVCGGTDGIGRAYAIELAKRGLNVLVIGRNPDKLNKAAETIRSSTKKEIEVRTIEFDFDEDGDEFDSLREQLDPLDIGVLVNCAGASSDLPTEFLKVSQEMIRLVLPGMLERKRGAIVNISSGAAVHPSPLYAAYSATKAYVDSLSHSLAIEYGRRGIMVQNVQPMLVATKMSKARVSILSPTPRAYVKQAISTLGLLRTTHGFWSHVIEGWGAHILPCAVVDNMIYKFNENWRENYLQERNQRKQERNEIKQD